MKKKPSKPTSKPGSMMSRHITFFLFFLVLAVASAFMIKPFFTIIVVSAILAYALYKPYQGFLIMFKRKGVAAGIIVLMLLILVIAPMVLVIGTITKESVDAYQYIKTRFQDGYCTGVEDVGCTTYLLFKDWAERHNVDLGEHMRQGVTSVAGGLLKHVSDFVLNLPSIFLQLFFTLFMTYYFLKEGDGWLEKIKKTLPLDEKVKGDIVKKFNDVVHATLYGAVIISIIQGVLAFIAYMLLGAPSPLLFGFLTLIATFIPFLGGALVWGPLSVWMLIHGITQSNNILVYKAIGLFLFGLFVISTIDNILKPKIVGDRARMHPLVILLGVFGGLAVFGIIGLLIGPMILALFITSIKIFEQQKKNIKF